MAKQHSAQTRRERWIAEELVARVSRVLLLAGVDDVEILPGVGWDGRPYAKVMCVRDGLKDLLESHDLAVDVRNVCTIVRETS